MGWPRHQSIEQTKEFRVFSEAEWNRWPAGPYLIECQGDRKFLGGTGLAFETPTLAATEMDQDQGGTPPVEFVSDLAEFRTLFNRFCTHKGEFAPHAMWGQMSRTERMRYAYLHIDHHFRQFGA